MSFDGFLAFANSDLTLCFLFFFVPPESKFHTYIERTSFKSESAAWQKVVEAGDTLEIPSQLASWVAADPSPAAPIQPAENKTAAAEPATA